MHLSVRVQGFAHADEPAQVSNPFKRTAFTHTRTGSILTVSFAIVHHRRHRDRVVRRGIGMVSNAFKLAVLSFFGNTYLLASNRVCSADDRVRLLRVSATRDSLFGMHHVSCLD